MDDPYPQPQITSYTSAPGFNNYQPAYNEKPPITGIPRYPYPDQLKITFTFFKSCHVIYGRPPRRYTSPRPGFQPPGRYKPQQPDKRPPATGIPPYPYGRDRATPLPPQPTYYFSAKPIPFRPRGYSATTRPTGGSFYTTFTRPPATGVPPFTPAPWATLIPPPISYTSIYRPQFRFTPAGPGPRPNGYQATQRPFPHYYGPPSPRPPDVHRPPKPLYPLTQPPPPYIPTTERPGPPPYVPYIPPETIPMTVPPSYFTFPVDTFPETSTDFTTPKQTTLLPTTSKTQWSTPTQRFTPTHRVTPTQPFTPTQRVTPTQPFTPTQRFTPTTQQPTQPTAFAFSTQPPAETTGTQTPSPPTKYRSTRHTVRIPTARPPKTYPSTPFTTKKPFTGSPSPPTEFRSTRTTTVTVPTFTPPPITFPTSFTTGKPFTGTPGKPLPPFMSTDTVPNRMKGKAHIICEPDGIVFTAQTFFPFFGEVFSRDHFTNPKCYEQYAGGSTDINVTFLYAECGRLIPGARPGETMYEVEVVINYVQVDGSVTSQSFLARGMSEVRQVSEVVRLSLNESKEYNFWFISSASKGFINRCESQRIRYAAEDVPRQIEEALEELNLVPIKIEKKAEIPGCLMRVVPESESDHHHYGPSNHSAISDARIGQQLRIEWSLQPPSEAYGFIITDCRVKDHVSGKEYLVIDGKGCSTDINILGHPHYDTYHDLAIVHWHAFKVPDDRVLSITCHFHICSDIEGDDGKTNCAEIPAPPFCPNVVTVSPQNSLLLDFENNFLARRLSDELQVEAEVCVVTDQISSRKCKLPDIFKKKNKSRRKEKLLQFRDETPDTRKDRKMCLSRLMFSGLLSGSILGFLLSLGIFFTCSSLTRRKPVPGHRQQIIRHGNYIFPWWFWPEAKGGGIYNRFSSTKTKVYSASLSNSSITENSRTTSASILSSRS